MSLQESAENYLETILILQQREKNVRSIDIVNELSYSKPSVSVAVKKLKENGHVEVDDSGHISLTQSGRDIAEQMYERHKKLTSFFISIGVSPETAADDACKIEHIISDECFEAIKRHMQ